MLKILFKFCLLIGLVVGIQTPFFASFGPSWSGAALADDHDDGGDDDDDDGGAAGDDDDDDDRVIRRAPRVRQAPARRVAPVPLPFRAPDEIVAPRLAEADFQNLLAQGYTLIEAYQRPDDSVARRLRIPPGIALEAARETVRTMSTGETADFNHFYRTEQAEAVAATVPDTAATRLATGVTKAAVPIQPVCQGPHCANWQMIGWPQDPDRAQACTGEVTIGLIDTGLNARHQALDHADLTVIRSSPDALPQSEALHGTAVAALLVGKPGSRSPGLLPGARVIAVDAFHQAKGDQRADVFSLIKGMTQLADAGADVINLSLAGPANSALRDTVLHLSGERNVIIVAAAGNAGPKAWPRFPAAYGPVIAVTAVDRDHRVYRRAVTGKHIDIAAPGVDVWTAASISGARSKTGTSFAAPFVTATIALMRGQNPDLTAEAARQMLARDARDLGAPGPDPVFGHGLISAASLCPG